MDFSLIGSMHVMTLTPVIDGSISEKRSARGNRLLITSAQTSVEDERRRSMPRTESINWQNILFDTRAPGWSILVRLLVGLVVFFPEGIQKLAFPEILGAGRFANIGIPHPNSHWSDYRRGRNHLRRAHHSRSSNQACDDPTDHHHDCRNCVDKNPDPARA